MTQAMVTVDFYFDFISPFGYLSRFRLDEIVQQSGVIVRYHAIDLPTIKKAAGNTGPSNRDIPPKIIYLTEDLRRWAERYGVAMVERLAGADTAGFNKGLYLALERGVAADYVRHAWDCNWREGKDPGLVETRVLLAQKMQWDEKEFELYVNSDAAQQRYDQENREAIERGIFGVPTFAIGEQIWWGNDRLDFLQETIAQQVGL